MKKQGKMSMCSPLKTLNLRLQILYIIIIETMI